MSYKRIKTDDIIPNPEQPRQDFDEESIRELAQSFHGEEPLEPPVVMPVGGDSSLYMLIVGERRLKAARIAGLTELVCKVREDLTIDSPEVGLLQLEENDQREDLNPIERGKFYIGYRKRYGLTQQELADKLKTKKQYDISRYESLTKLSYALCINFRAGLIPLTVAFSLAKIENKKKQELVYQTIQKFKVTNTLTIDKIIRHVAAPEGIDTEQLVNDIIHPPKETKKKKNEEIESKKVISSIMEFRDFISDIDIRQFPSEKFEQLHVALEQVLNEIYHKRHEVTNFKPKDEGDLNLRVKKSRHDFEPDKSLL